MHDPCEVRLQSLIVQIHLYRSSETGVHRLTYTIWPIIRSKPAGGLQAGSAEGLIEALLTAVAVDRQRSSCAPAFEQAQQHQHHMAPNAPSGSIT